jgi:hypothetical protein
MPVSPFGCAEARNIVFLKIDVVAALFRHENNNSHQSVSFGSALFGFRPEWISSFPSDACIDWICRHLVAMVKEQITNTGVIPAILTAFR